MCKSCSCQNSRNPESNTSRIPCPTTNGAENLQFLKAPVEKLGDLYERYPDGGEWGWFAFVVEKGAFAYWNKEKEEWQLVSNYNPEQLLNLQVTGFRTGDIFAWDEKQGKFVPKSLVPIEDELKRLGEVSELAPFVDFFEVSANGGRYSTYVHSTVGGRKIPWSVTNLKDIPVWLQAQVEGDRLVLKVAKNDEQPKELEY